MLVTRWDAGLLHVECFRAGATEAHASSRSDFSCRPLFAAAKVCGPLPQLRVGRGTHKVDKVDFEFCARAQKHADPLHTALNGLHEVNHAGCV